MEPLIFCLLYNQISDLSIALANVCSPSGHTHAYDTVSFRFIKKCEIHQASYTDNSLLVELSCL